MREHSIAVIWMLYLLGQFVHILKRAGMAVRSKRNSIHSRIVFIAFYWDALLVRIVLCAGLFWVLQTNPRGLTNLFALLGVNIGADISVDLGSALIFGYFADSVLDWLVSKIPILQKELPALNGSSHPAP
ncbi:MAG: hypothetical protein HY234_03650 [Acidobacteria bacterium]|nr:hypothetical protein [Acidobacteriota bacterium]MBI3662131.1 hypothetical protein [Acidobacteriota bacterium]